MGDPTSQDSNTNITNLPLINARTNLNAVALEWPFRKDAPFCAVCQNLNPDGRDQNNVRRLPVRLLSYHCSGCSFLRALHNSFALEAYQQLSYHWSGGRLVVRFAGPHGQKHEVSLYCNDHLDCNEVSFVDNSEFFHPVSKSSVITESSEAMAWLQQQVADCDATSQHDKCDYHHSSLPPILPSRVLEIDSPSKVRLHIPAQSERAHYVCLSHCWGGKQPITTQRSTLEVHKRGFLVERLPKTFQDAITVVHKLGIRYLWIDSLCIVQDDLDDWRIEGSKMATIYQSSYLTISAVSASDSTAGLFVTAPVVPDQMIRFLDSEHKIIVRSHKFNHNYSHYMPRAKDAPLMERAWAFQELLLAPRTVHFAAKELIWVCNSLTTCQCLNTSEPLPYYFRAYKMMVTEPAHSNTREMWRRVVEEYTQRKLTFESDIFPALSGLGHYFAQHRTQGYFAGLWRETLLHDLLWWKWSVASNDRRPFTWRAPTWSWASVVGEVLWDTFNSTLRYHATARVEVQLAGPDECGELASGTLWLSAPAVLATFSGGGVSLGEPGSPTRLRSSETLQNTYFCPDYAYDRGGNNNRRVSESDVIHVVLIAQQCGRTGLELLFCLVLLDVGGDPRTFERIGLVRCRLKKECNGSLGPFQEVGKKTFTIIFCYECVKPAI